MTLCGLDLSGDAHIISSQPFRFAARVGGSATGLDSEPPTQPGVKEGSP